jgi:hypothetical protein
MMTAIAVGPPPPGIAIHEANQAQLRGQQRAGLRRPPGARAAAQLNACQKVVQLMAMPLLEALSVFDGTPL